MCVCVCVVCACLYETVCASVRCTAAYILSTCTRSERQQLYCQGESAERGRILRSFSVPATLPSLSGPHDIACASSPTGSRDSDIATVYLIPYLPLYRRFPSEFHSTTATSPSTHARIHVIAVHITYI